MLLPRSTTVGLLDQEPGRSAAQVGDRAATVRDHIADVTGVAEADHGLQQASEALASEGGGADRAAADYEVALERYLRAGVADFDARLAVAAETTGLGEALLGADPARLSGGEAERMALTAIVMSRFDLTLLDEPTNNLDLDGLDLLEQWIADHDGGLVIVSHDRAFLERTITSVIEIDHHHRTVATYQGGWRSFLDERDRARRHHEERYATYVDERDRLKRRAQQQREWVDRGASRAVKNPADGDIFRKRWAQAQTEKLAGKSKATLRALDRLEEVDKPWEPWRLQFTIATADRSADIAATFDRAVLRRGSWSIGPIDHEVRWADRLAVVGPNGSGKSSLIAALDRPPRAGVGAGAARCGRCDRRARPGPAGRPHGGGGGPPAPRSWATSRTGPAWWSTRPVRCWPSSASAPRRSVVHSGRCRRGSGPATNWPSSRPGRSTS